MKGDPKTVQITHHPSVSLLIYKGEGDINDSQEVEISGKAVIVKDRQERRKALEITAKRSPVVKYLVEAGNDQVLDCIKVVPEVVKLRIFKEIVQGLPPTVIEFPENRTAAGDLELLKTKVRSWAIELRMPFLTASVVPVLLGTTIAWAGTGVMHWGYFVLTLIAAVLLHAGTNVVNDYFDHLSGNDETNREFVRPFSGGSRVIQLGLLTPFEVLVGGLFLSFLASLIGLYLTWARGPLILALGAVGLVSGLFYTGRPFNWASRGIGEILIGLNFGVLMTLGAYYVQARTLSWTPIIAAIPIALLIAAVLWINEFPDYRADKAVGKRTLVVRLGRSKAAVAYGLLMVCAHLVLLAGVVAGILPLAALLGLIPFPLSLRAIQCARVHYASSFDLVPANALTVISHLATGLLLTLAYAWEGFGRQGLGYVVLLGAMFVAFVIYMYRYIEKQKDIFLGLKQVVR
jgi:1,4-dihydroxy-2-naphthoate octaprenyltransferase